MAMSLVASTFIDGAELSRHEEKVRRRKTKGTFRYR